MRKIIIGVMIVSFLAVYSGTGAFADDAIKKLSRGACNIITCPLEIGKAIGDVNNDNGFIAALSYGLLSGIWKTAVRGVVGIYEFVTFPLPFPKDYAPILTDPEFFLEDK
ncbi:MAG: exosortase system-associated protein, TIGR04073 family [Candidatus Omnitrophica bacterium]|nr:exosortase system-associated protein, TIGR04073 family [Candidatus Omnitrophota bacterium]